MLAPGLQSLISFFSAEIVAESVLLRNLDAHVGRTNDMLIFVHEWCFNSTDLQIDGIGDGRSTSTSADRKINTQASSRMFAFAKTDELGSRQYSADRGWPLRWFCFTLSRFSVSKVSCKSSRADKAVNTTTFMGQHKGAHTCAPPNFPRWDVQHPDDPDSERTPCCSCPQASSRSVGWAPHPLISSEQSSTSPTMIASPKILPPSSMDTSSRVDTYGRSPPTHKVTSTSCIHHIAYMKPHDLVLHTHHAQLRNGPKNVTNAWIDWHLTFITHVNPNNIVMWETLQNNAYGDWLKTLTSQEILRIQNLHLEKHCAFFWKSYICSNKLDVQETNLSFTQFNRIRKHLFGRWIEIRRAPCSRVVGSDFLRFGKHDSDNRDWDG